MQKVARRALAHLYNNTVLAGLVFRDYDEEFKGKQGATVTVRTPAVLKALEFDRQQGIQLQNVTEGQFAVTLDTLLDVSVPITAEELTLEMDAFDERVLIPMMEAIVQGVDARLAVALVEAARSAGNLAEFDGNGSRALRRAKALLGRKKLPLAERYGVWSPEGAEAAFEDDKLVKANERGDTDGLREAALGRIAGFDNLESQVMGDAEDVEDVDPDGVLAEVDGVAFHKSAVALVTRTLDKPLDEGADVAVENYKGLGLRVVKGYDQKFKQDIISVDLLIGVKTVRDYAAVELDVGGVYGSGS